jgi:hypothetical protein
MQPGDIVRLVWDRMGSDDDVLVVDIDSIPESGIPDLIEVLWNGNLVWLDEKDVEVFA